MIICKRMEAEPVIFLGIKENNSNMGKNKIDRRGFLKTAGATAVSLTIPSFVLVGNALERKAAG